MRRLKLMVSPQVIVGDELSATISAEGIERAIITLSYPDNVRLEGEDQIEVALDSTPLTLSWRVLSLSEALSAMVEIKVNADGALQFGLVKVLLPNATFKHA